MSVELHIGIEIQRMESELLHITDTLYTHCLYALALQVVEQGYSELAFLSELRRIGEVGIHQVGRRTLQRTFGIGVNPTFRKVYVGVHVGRVDSRFQVFHYFLACFHFNPCSQTVGRVLERMHHGTTGRSLRTLDRTIQILVVGRDGHHVGGRRTKELIT